MTVEVTTLDWFLQTGGPTGLLGYFLWQISNQLGELKGLVRGVFDGRNEASKKINTN